MIKANVIDCCDDFLCSYNVIKFKCPCCKEIIENDNLYSIRFDCINGDPIDFKCSFCENEIKMIYNNRDAEFYILKNK